MQSIYADDITLHYFGHSTFAGARVGKDRAIAAVMEMGSRAQRSLIVVEEILVSADGVVVVDRERLERDGEVVEVRRLFRYRVVDGSFAEAWVYDEDQRLMDRLGA